MPETIVELRATLLNCGVDATTDFGGLPENESTYEVMALQIRELPTCARVAFSVTNLGHVIVAVSDEIDSSDKFAKFMKQIHRSLVHEQVISKKAPEINIYVFKPRA